MRPFVHQFDTAVARLIGNWPVSLRPLFLIVTALGDPIITIAIGSGVAVYGYLQSNLRLALSGLMIWLTLGVGSCLKVIFGRQRPDSEYAHSLQIPTHSFPSGHAGGSIVAYGLVAYIAWHLLPQPWNYIIVGLLALLVVLIGISRIYLGAHFPSDVIAGWALGGVALLVIIFVIKPLA